MTIPEHFQALLADMKWNAKCRFYFRRYVGKFFLSLIGNDQFALSSVTILAKSAYSIMAGTKFS